MALRTARDALSRFFYQRCFWLFTILLVLIAGAPFLPATMQGRLVFNWINAFVVIATVAAVGRTLLSFVIALLLAAPALVFQWLGLSDADPRWLSYSWMFAAALYLATVTYLLRYVFRPEVMTADKLFGAAASYLMLGVLWAYFYAIVSYFDVQSFAVHGQPSMLNSYEAIYFSMSVLTGSTFGDITALTRQAQAVCIVEQVTGVLFVTILIARLSGVYPPQRRTAAE